MYNLTKLLTVVFALVCVVSFAQEEKKSPLTISGSVDAYYQTFINASDDINPVFGTSFADQTGFALGMANVVLSYEGKKTGMVADIAFGPRANAAVIGNNINQLYAYWNVSESTTLTLGQFNTYLGYEVISPTGNFNYSTSFLFSSGPFSHVGLKADFALSDDFSLMLAVMNATDIENNITGDYALGAQLGFKGQYLNFYYDSGIKLGFEVDYTGGFDLSDSFFLGINAAYQTSTSPYDADENGGFYGVALYPQFSLSDSFALGLRGEYFGDHDSTDGFEGTSVLGLTLTGSYTLENLTIKPEIRVDSLSDDLEYITNSDLDTSASLAAFTLAAIYSF